MLVALNKENERIYASASEHYTDCFCPECGEKLIHKKGLHNRPYFSHIPDTTCAYGRDADNKSPWHIHMQEIFPQESLEVRFKDKKTSEVHIADVFIQESNTVIEFQHSPISDKEFVSRTMFHVSEGRRIVWIFDETRKNSALGKFEKTECPYTNSWIHNDYEYDWKWKPRKMLSSIRTSTPLDQCANYSICAYCGDEENTVHRIISQNFGYQQVVFSVHHINLHSDMDTNDFFQPETHWLSMSPWKEVVDEYKAKQVRLEEINKRKKEANDAAIRKSFYDAMTKQSHKRSRL